ncbi:MAG TPA: MlaD family protein [Kofleriaceae bacterium]|jgi:phospholipid/cholesterol/gamma-HCH transport system substrate-binding protein|nr:MlaD family protein [Kofleriaceae bacterium]
MRERGLELKVGILILIAAAILVGFVYVLGNFSLSSGFTVYVDYNYSGSLQAGAPVKVAGIKVGKVRSVEFLGGQIDPKTNRRVQVRVEAWVENKAHDAIRQDSEYFINTAGVLGEQYLEIVPGKDWDHPPIEADSIHVGMDPPRTDLVVSRLYTVLDSLSEVLRDDKDTIKHLLENSAQTVATLNTILKENKADVQKLIVGAGALADQASQSLAKVNVGLGDGKVLAQTLRDADGVLVAARGAINAVTPPAVALLTDGARVTSTLTEDRIDKAFSLADKGAAAIGKAGHLVDNVDGMVTDLRAGKGTAGALLVKEDIYADLRELIRDLKRNPWKFFWKE